MIFLQLFQLILNQHKIQCFFILMLQTRTKRRNKTDYYFYKCVLEFLQQSTAVWENQVVKIVVPYFAAGFGNNYSKVMLTLPFLSRLARHFYQQRWE